MSKKQPQGVFKNPSDLKAFHETTDLDIKGVAVFTIGLVAMCAVTLIGLRIMMNGFASEEREAKERAPSRLIVDAPIDGPRLQAESGQERQEIAKRDLGRLNSYGWLDQKAGTAHIPIERAIAILSEKGLPEVGKADPFHPRPGSTKSAGTESEPAAGAKP